jgi:hypothetical protein
MGKGIIMEKYFESLVERAQYFEHFEFFREDAPSVRVGFNNSEQIHKEVIIVELVLKQKQEKNV